MELSCGTGSYALVGPNRPTIWPSLKLSNEARNTKPTGDIVNLMAVDSQRLQDITQFSQHLWSAPLQIVLCLVSLYSLLGYSMFAGIVLIVVTIPINRSITKSMRGLQKQQMKYKDARSKLTAEVIANMKFIKLFAWGSDGQITQQGTYDQLRADRGDFASLIVEVKIPSQTATESTMTSSLSATEGITYSQQEPGHLSISKATETLHAEQTSVVKGRASISGSMDPWGKTLDIEAAISNPKPDKELTHQGHVKWKVYGDCAKASSLWAAILYAAMLKGAQVAQIGGNIWLKQWSEATYDLNAGVDIKKYLGIYVAFGLGSAGLAILQSLTLWL
ncbi:hypothetical protein ACKLNR_006173 [Fusarium oxysporum f. sp. zingiberi]